jgi:hypothetical protein
VDEFVCLVVRSGAGESEADFSARLSRFWTHMLRTRLSDFEKVYAETTHFEHSGDRLTRRYAVVDSVVEVLEGELVHAGLEHEPVDRDDVYSKYETVAPEWMQIEH